MSVYQRSKIIYIETLESTNNYASSNLTKEKETDRVAIVTNEQTKGKGQQHNTWESEPFKNLTFSLIYLPQNLLVAEQFAISQATSLAIHEILSVFCQGIKIKWPNDIYWKGKKIAGILIENKILGTKISSSIIGCGININQDLFSSDAPNPISLKQITQKDYDLKNLLNQFLERINFWLDKIEKKELDKLQKKYINELFLINQWAEFAKRDEKFTGKIIGIDKYGQLIIKHKNGDKEHFMFKEVEFMI